MSDSSQLMQRFTEQITEQQQSILDAFLAAYLQTTHADPAEVVLVQQQQWEDSALIVRYWCETRNKERIEDRWASSWDHRSVGWFWKEYVLMWLDDQESADVLERWLRSQLSQKDLDLIIVRFGFETGDKLSVAEALRRTNRKRSEYMRIIRGLRHPFRRREIQSFLEQRGVFRPN